MYAFINGNSLPVRTKKEHLDVRQTIQVSVHMQISVQKFLTDHIAGLYRETWQIEFIYFHPI